MIIDYTNKEKSPAPKAPVEPLRERFPDALNDTIEEIEKNSFFKTYLLEFFHKVAQKAFRHVRFRYLREDEIEDSLNAFLESDHDALTDPEGFTMLMAVDEENYLYDWKYHIACPEGSKGYSFTCELSRFMPPNTMIAEVWDDRLNDWQAIEFWDAFDLEKELTQVYKSGGPKAALFAAAVAQAGSALTVEDWERILKEQSLLLELAGNLKEKEILFMSSPEGFVLLPAKHHLTGLGIRQEKDGLMLLQFIPDHPLQAVRNLLPGKKQAYARDIGRVSREEALWLIRASRYKELPQYGFYSLLLPLSKNRLVFCQELPTQLEGPRFPMNVREKELTPQEAAALKEFRSLLDLNSFSSGDFLL